MNGPKNLDLYLKAENINFMSSVQCIIKNLEMSSKGINAVWYMITDNRNSGSYVKILFFFLDSSVFLYRNW